MFGFSKCVSRPRAAIHVVCAGLLLYACGCSGPADVATGEQALRIGMMPKLVGIGYFDATAQGAREAADELGIELIYDGPTEARTEDQIRMINGWAAQGFDVIAIAPNDPDGIARTLLDVGDSGVTVLTWDTDANPETSEREVFVNQAPNDAIGFALVEAMVDGIIARGGDIAGEYLIVSGTPTASNQNTWMEHMRAKIEQEYPEMKLLEPLYPGEDQQKSQEQTAEALAANPNLKGIWGITSVSCPAAAKVVRDANRADEVFVTGLSLPNMMREYINDGTVDHFVLWNPVDLGYLTVYAADRLFRSGLPAGTHDFGRLTGIEVRDGQAILGNPLRFSRDNIDEFHF